MNNAISRAIMAVAARCLGQRRQDWSAAMQAEFETAAPEGAALQFATGCLIAAAREMFAGEEGRFALTSYALVLGLMIPMAALQVGCALLGLPYLYPGSAGLSGAMLEIGTHEEHLRGVYQAAVPTLAMLQLMLGLGHMRIAWAVVERDWAGIARLGIRTVAAATTLLIFLTVLFLNSSQALIQITVLGVELATVWMVARWHAALPEPVQRPPYAV